VARRPELRAEVDGPAVHGLPCDLRKPFDGEGPVKVGDPGEGLTVVDPEGEGGLGVVGYVALPLAEGLDRPEVFTALSVVSAAVPVLIALRRACCELQDVGDVGKPQIRAGDRIDGDADEAAGVPPELPDVLGGHEPGSDDEVGLTLPVVEVV